MCSKWGFSTHISGHLVLQQREFKKKPGRSSGWAGLCLKSIDYLFGQKK
jgi:hypothetical protein